MNIVMMNIIMMNIMNQDFLYLIRGEEDPKKRQKRANQGISESILSKDQLYEMFQMVLGIKKFEHQLIFNAAQVI